MKSRFEPKFLSVLRKGYPKENLLRDVTAGLIVGILSLPMSIAFAIASGARPEQGLYTAIIAGFIVSFFGGSRFQISGPTGAFVVLIYTIINQHSYEGLLLATVMAGIMLVAMGVLGLGSLVRFIPYPVTIGFTSGLAVALFSSQIKDFFGLPIPKLPVAFSDQWVTYLSNFSHFHLLTASASIATVVIIFCWDRYKSKIPGALIGIVVMTLFVCLFQIPVETIGSRYGDIPNSLPPFHLPNISIDLCVKMFPSAVAIALLSGIDALLCAVVADGMAGTRHRPNIELIAQGLSNIANGLFLALPSTGAIARTATNVKNGARTPLAGIVNSLSILLMVLFFGKLVVYIPMCTLAAIMALVCYNMSEWRYFLKILQGPKQDRITLVSTFLVTVFIGVTEAIQVGVVLAALLFMMEMSKAPKAKKIWPAQSDDFPNPTFSHLSGSIQIFSIQGPFFFGAADRFRKIFSLLKPLPKTLILELSSVSTIDASGLHLLEEFDRQCKKSSVALILAGLSEELFFEIQKSSLDPTSLFSTLEEALSKIEPAPSLPADTAISLQTKS